MTAGGAQPFFYFPFNETRLHFDAAPCDRLQTHQNRVSVALGRLFDLQTTISDIVN